MGHTKRTGLWALWLALLLPMAAQAHDNPQPIANTEGGSGVVAVAPGGLHTCGLRADGSAACWGSNGIGQSTPPTPNGPYLSLSSGGYHTCGVKADGSVECWGAGEPGSSGALHSGQSTVPDEMAAAGAAAFGQIAAGNAHACDLRRDGTVSCWGDNTDGQTNAPTTTGYFTQVVAGNNFSCGLGADGKVACWGVPFPRFSTSPPVPPVNALATYRQLAAGLNGGLTLLTAAPDSTSFHTPAGTIVEITQSNMVAALTPLDARNISHGIGSFSSGYCAVRSDGTGTCTGLAVPAGNSWQRIEAGLTHACGLKADGSLSCWGDNGVGQTTNVPTGQFRALSAGYNHACAIKADGQLACWGSNISGQTDAPAGTYVQVAAGNTFTCAIRSDGRRVCWGANGAGADSPNPAGLSDLADGQMGVAYSQQITISGSSAPANPVFLMMSGTLPPGLSLSPAGALSGTPTSLGSYTFTIDAEGDGEFAASRAYTIVIADGSPPQISYTLNGASGPPAPTPDGANGWYVGDVVLDWTVTDPESAVTIDSGCMDATVATDTNAAGVAHACSVISAGGSASESVTIKRDATLPTIEVSPATAANAAGWHNADVTVLVACADASPGSGVAACPSVAAVVTEGSTTVPAQAVTDNAGNTASSDPLDVKLDKTPPTIGAAATTTPDGDNGWYRGNATVHFTCSDALSGLAGSCPADQVLSTDGSAVNSSAGVATDNAGNTATSNIVTVKIDQAAPTLDPTAPSPLLRGHSYVASPNASDATSGVASSNCGALDTGSLGSKSTTCSATDNAGNAKTVTLNYTVTTTCSNDGYSGTQLTWCNDICEKGLTGAALNTAIRRWINRYHDDGPYCLAEPQPQVQ